MASTPPPGGGPSRAMTIGRNFVKQYYNVLSTSPEEIVKFYKPVSVFSHGQGSVPTTPTSIEESNALLKDRLFSSKSCRLDLEHGAIDAQMSLGGGVLVVVTGRLVTEGQRRAFSHTFFLNDATPPDSKKTQYYVHNDIMRFLADETPDQVEDEEAVAEVTQEEIVVEKAEEVPEATEEPAAVAPAKEEPVVEREVVPEPVVEETPMYEPALEPEPAVEETKEEIVEERESSKSKRKGKSRGGRKKSLSPTSDDAKARPARESWASMVAHNASTTMPPSPPRRARTEKKDTEATTAKEENKPAKQEQQQGRQQGKQKLRDPDCTLVIKNVPEGTRDRDIRELFEPFAVETKSRIVGLNVAGSKSLAFVDYDSPQPVLLALQDKQQFQLQGRKLELEPKMVDKNRSKGSGGRQKGGDGSSNGFRGSGSRSGQQRRRGSGGGRGGGGGGGGGRGGRGGK